MENLFYKTDADLKKPLIGKYTFMNGSFFAAAVPEKMSFFARLRLKKQLRLFDGALVCFNGTPPPYIRTWRADGSICICENIEPLCRKLCKNNSIQMPPSAVLCDESFTVAGAKALKGLGRICSRIYVVTKSRTAYGYAENMLDEFGCVVTVTQNMPDADIIIAADRIETSGGAVVIDLFGENVHITNGRVSELFFEYREISEEDRWLLGGVCGSRMYDFLKLSGIDIGKNVNFIGYG